MSCDVRGDGTVSWLYINYETAEQLKIYKDRSVVEQFNGTFTALSRTNYTGGTIYSLSMFSVQLDDSGWYLCVQEETDVMKYVTALSEFFI